jgi:hypothetical protein
MYILCVILFVVAFSAAAVLVPFRWSSRLAPAIDRLRQLAFGRPEVAAIQSDEPRELRYRALLQRWGIASAVLYVAIGLVHGTIFLNHPSSVVAAIIDACLSIVFAAALLALFDAVYFFLPRLRAFNLLSRCGLRAIWLAQPQKQNRRLQESLLRRACKSEMLGVVDITGFELLGKGPGPAGGLLYDAISRARHLPVYLVLCNPESEETDPERKVSTVLQNLLGEMNLSPTAYARRLKATVDAVQALNQERPEGSRIIIRFYREKPTFRALVFDDAAIALSWNAREDAPTQSFLEVLRDSEHGSFYETFRRHFARLWGTPVDEPEADGARKQARIIHRQAESRVLSDSFEIRPVMTAATAAAVEGRS